ncbi:MAG: hypothetical protein ACFE96_03810 [Candidatus Hermodarchaeota archaeon]
MNGWLNGKESLLQVNRRSQDVIALYQGDYYLAHTSRTTSRFFGTHDWIAECALEILFFNYPSNRYIEMLYLDISQIKLYYLIGTEAPDAVQHDRFPSTGIDCREGNKPIYAVDLPNPPHHHLRFNQQGGIYVDYLVDASEDAAYIAWNSLIAGYCRRAAFYLGVMAHFIGDAVFYPHLIDSSPSWRNIIWNRVFWLTSKKINDWYYNDGSITTEAPFFTNDDARYEFLVHKPQYIDAWEAGGLAAHYAGYDTHFGYAKTDSKAGFRIQTHKSAEWMEDNVFNDFAIDFDISKPERRENWLNHYTGSDRDWLVNLKHNLNVAVYYCAAAMRYIIQTGYSSCKKPLEKELSKTITNMFPHYSYMWLMAWVGNFATFVVLSQNLIFSNTVLEHVYNLKLNIEKINLLLKRGGFTYHRVDLRDHLHLRDKYYLDFLKYPEKYWRFIGDTNRIRYLQYLKIFKKFNFDLLEINNRKLKSKGIRIIKKDFNKEFQKLSDKDLSIIRFNIITKKPIS